MKHYLYIVQKSFKEVDPEQINLPCSGFVFFYSFTDKKLDGIYRKASDNFLDQKCECSIEIDLPAALMKKSDSSQCIRIRRTDFKKFLNTCREKYKMQEEKGYLRIANGELFLSSQRKNRFVSAAFNAYGIEAYLRRIAYENLMQDNVSENNVTENRILKQFPEMKDALVSVKKSETVYLSGSSFRAVAVISSLLNESQVVINTLVRQNIRREERTRSIRKILVISNHSGEDLKGVKESGAAIYFRQYAFEMKHISGRIHSSQIRYYMENFTYDLVVYRGHAEVKSGRIFWMLEDENYSPPVNAFARYIHSACLYSPDGEEELTEFPFREGLLPSGYYRDHSDEEWLKRFLHSLSEGISFFSAWLMVKRQAQLNYWTN